MTLVNYTFAALAEIAGCFAFWAWAGHGTSALWLVPGSASLVLFAWLLARSDAAFAGRAFAAYGGIYVAASLAWLWSVEGRIPDRWDLTGSVICIVGALIVLWGPRAV